MEKNDILSIIHMRIAVYTVGTQIGAWKDIDANGASDMMSYLFPKSGQLAYFQLIMEQMRAHHNMLTGGVYYLFKMPVQVEKEILEFLRNEEVDLTSFKENASDYLKEMDTIPTDHRFTAVGIGAFSTQDIMNLLRLCSSHYRYSFEHHIESYPYFE